MSALPPKADMCGAARDVCFGPKADIRSFNWASGFLQVFPRYGLFPLQFAEPMGVKPTWKSGRAATLGKSGHRAAGWASNEEHAISRWLSGAATYAATHCVLVGSLRVFHDQPLWFAVGHTLRRWLSSCTLDSLLAPQGTGFLRRQGKSYATHNWQEARQQKQKLHSASFDPYSGPAQRRRRLSRRLF